MPVVSESFKERLLSNLPKIIEKFGPVFHIYDEGGIRKTLQGMKAAFATHNLPYQQFYAVKALPRPAIMDIISEEGCGFDCSSIPELRLARKAGAKPEDIMFTSNNTSDEEFAEALKHGGCIMNLDDIIFVDKLDEVCRKEGVKFPSLICFRLNPGSRKTGDEVNKIIGNPLDSKYGVPIEQIVDAYRLAKKYGDKNMEFGLHTMVCSNDRDYTHMVSTYALLLEVAGRLHDELGIKLKFVNVGGGIGIPYHPTDPVFDFEAMVAAFKALSKEFKKERRFLPAIFTESGRYATGPHGILVNPVINVYDKYKQVVGVHTAMPALMRVGMYGVYHHSILVDANGREVTGPTRPTTIAGPICENCDVLANGIELPRAFVGYRVLTFCTGAHGSAMTFNYNGRCRPPELLMRTDDVVVLICWGETYEDLERRHKDLFVSKCFLRL